MNKHVFKDYGTLDMQCMYCGIKFEHGTMNNDCDFVISEIDKETISNTPGVITAYKPGVYYLGVITLLWQCCLIT